MTTSETELIAACRARNQLLASGAWRDDQATWNAAVKRMTDAIDALGGEL